MARSSLRLIGLAGLTALTFAVGAWAWMLYNPANNSVTIKLPPPQTPGPGFTVDRSGAQQ
jgi:hypothetical protein